MASNTSNISSQGVSEHLKGISSVKLRPSPALTNIGSVAGASLANLQQAFKGIKEPPPIKHCPLSDPEIAKDTMLDTLALEKLPDIQKGMKADTPEDGLLRMAGNFLGGGLITGGDGKYQDGKFGLDGTWELPNYMIWEWALQNITQSAPPGERKAIDGLLEGIQQLKEYRTDLDKLCDSPIDEAGLIAIAMKYAKRIQQLKPGESQMCSGGWSNVGGGSGHALVYEFTRNQDGTFDVFLYTSTGYQLADVTLLGDKERLKPVIRYSRVPEEDVCFNGDGVVRPTFIQHIMEIDVLAKWTPDRIVNEEDVLETFDHLAKYQTPVSHEEFGAITGQRAGTCVVSSTKAWARRRAGSLASYKQAKFHINLRLMVGLYQALKVEMGADTERGNLTRRLLDQEARNFLREIAKDVKEGGVIEPGLARKAQATAYHLLKEVAAHQKAIEEKRRTGKVVADLDGIDRNAQRIKRKNQRSTMGIAPLSKGFQADSCVLPTIDSRIGNAADFVTAVDGLETFITTKVGKKNFYEALNLQIHRLVDQLPIPQPDPNNPGRWINDSFWSACSLGEKRKVLEAFERLAQLYTSTSGNDIPTRCHATVMTLHALTHHLAVDIDDEKRQSLGGNSEKRLSYFKIADFGKLANGLDRLLYLDKKEYERIQQATQYFDAFNATAKSHHSLFQSEKSTEIVKYSVHESLANGVFWQGLMEQDTTLQKLVHARGEVLWPHIDETLLQKEYDDAYKIYENDLTAYQLRADYEDYLRLEKLYANKLISDKPPPWNGPVPPVVPQPVKPKPKVNLPLHTKYTLVLENDIDVKHGLLASSGYNHIVILRKMTNRAHHWMKEEKIPSTFKTLAGRTSADSSTMGAMVQKDSVPPEKQTEALKSSVYQKQYRTMNDTHQNFFRDVVEAKRQVPSQLKSTAEWTALDEGSKPISLLDRLRRVASEWKLTPYQLILECSENLEQLTDPSFQTLFFTLFFRSPIGHEGKLHLGVGEMIAKDEALLTNCQQFITSGLNHFFKMRDAEGLKGARFFLELSFYLSKFLRDAGMEEESKKLDQTQFIDRWLQQDPVKGEEQSVLHLYRLLFSSLKKTHFLSNDELIKAYQSWITYNIHPDDGPWKSPMLVSLTKEAMTVLTEKISFSLSKDEDFRNQLGKGVIEALKLGNAPDTGWVRNTDNLIQVDYGLGERWTIDLVGGRVYSRAGALSNASAEHPWEKDHNFIRLFGESRFSYNSFGGDNYTFPHPELGAFRLVGSKEGYAIQRQFDLDLPESQGDWFEYQSMGGYYGYGTGFPSILFADHTYWKAPKQIDLGEMGTKIVLTGFFASLKDQKLCYATTYAGRVIRVNEKGIPIQPLQQIDYLDVKFNPEKVEGFKRIEQVDHILCQRDLKEEIQKIIYPRYSSPEGNTLQFISQKGKMVWSENTQYALPKEIPSGYLGKIDNYLYLESQDKKEPDKLLVPFQKVLSQDIPVPQGRLGIENETPLLPPKGEGPREQWGLYQYFMFNIVDGKIKPTTTESQLYLAYLHLSQLNYAKAIKMLRGIKLNEPLSPMGEKILELIIKMPSKEHHPDGNMVSLYAHFLSISKLDKASKNPILKYLNDPGRLWNLAVGFKSSIQSLNNISLECRLKQEEEKILIEKLIPELVACKAEILKLLPTAPFDRVVTALNHRLEYLEQSKQGDRVPIPIVTGARNLPKSDSGRFRGPFTNRLNFLLPDRPEGVDVARLKAIGLSDDTIKQSLKYYHEELEGYYNKIPKHVDWLGTGSTSILSSRPIGSCKIIENGKLLFEVMKTAKKGSQEERRALLYRLQQWRLHSTGQQEVPYLDLMMAILIAPNRYPEAVDLNASSEDKLNFLKTLLQTYNSAPPTEEDFNRVISPHSPPGGAAAPFPGGLYPIPERSSFDIREPTAKEIAPKPEQVVVNLQEDQTRWNTLEGWKSNYLEKAGKFMTSAGDDFELAFAESLINPGEEDFRESLSADLFKLKKDYLAGREQNREEIQWAIDKPGAEKLYQDASGEKQRVKDEIVQKKEELKKKVNVYSADPKVREEELAKIGGGAAREATYEDCVAKLLTMDFREYRLLNPHLQKWDVNQIAELTMQIEDLKSYEAQIDRIIELAEKIQKIDDVNDPTRRYHCQQLNTNLEARYHFGEFDSETQVALRVFSGETGIVPYAKQTDLIRSMMKLDKENPERFRDIVIQLIMGGGKTSVLATIILYLSAKREGRLSLFIVPAPLFQTVEANISESMKKAFRKDVQALDVSREDLTLHKLPQILKQLEEAKNKSEPMIVKATTLQCFELELLAQSRQLKKSLEEKRVYDKKLKTAKERVKKLEKTQIHLETTYQKGTAAYQHLKTELKQAREEVSQIKQVLDRKINEMVDNRQKVKLLGKICKQFPTTADALLDEVDLLLDCLQEVNFPDGDRVPIDPTTNSLILRAFQAITDPSLKIKTLEDEPSIVDVVRLQENQQTLMDPLRYKTHVAPVIAAELAKFSQIKNNLSGFGESFIRYASGKIPPILQEFVDNKLEVNEETLNQYLPNWRDYGITLSELEADCDFLKHLENLASKGDKKRKESADMMALAAHLLCDLLPATLGKSGRRDYGPSPQEDKSTIIPFLAVGTPAKTQFGYDLEEACYYYQWSAAFPVGEKDVRNMARAAETAARYYAEKNGEDYYKTVEYVQFKELFGLTLDEIHDPDKLAQAVETISKDVRKKLDIQYELVSQNVMFRSERLSSNGMNLVDQLHSRRTMSGTPWNVQGYDQKLYARFKADEGTEGRILHALAMRAKQEKLHEVDFTTVEQFMDQTLGKHPAPNNVRGIIEAGGIFKIFEDNAEVAKNLVAYIDKKQKDKTLNDKIEAVLFFHKDPGQAQANTLYAWRIGADNPERIGATTKEALKAKGLGPSNTFVYYDESHTTGVDILQDPEAVNFFTFDEKMIRRTIGQGIMRLRQYLFSQNAEIVVTKETRPMLVGKGEKAEDFVLSAEKTQSIRKTKDMVRYYKQQIDGLFRRHMVKDIVNAAAGLKDDGEEKFAEQVATNEPFFVTSINREHYQVHGRLKRQLNTKEMLLKYLEDKLTGFENKVTDINLMNAVYEDVTLLRKHIENADSLPVNWTEISAHIGVEQEVEVQTEMQLEAEVTIRTEVETEVDLELQRYENDSYGAARDVQKLSQEQLFDLIDMIKAKKPRESQVFSLQKQLSKFNYGLLDEKVPYQEAFSPNIYGTIPYFYSSKGDKTLAVFHKMQRPPKQILAVRVGTEMHWLLLSEHEANSVRTHLKTLYEQGDKRVEGVWLVQPDGSGIAGDKRVEEFPLHDPSVKAGLLEINAFAGNADYLDKRQNDLETWLANKSDLKIRFLKLRTARDVKKNEVLRRIPLIQRRDRIAAAHNPAGHIFRLRAEKEKSYQGTLALGEVPTKLIDPNKVKDVNINFVKYLGIDYDLNWKDPVTTEALMELDKTISNDQFPMGSKEREGELKRLADERTIEQFKRLADFQISSLTPQQIKWLPPEKVEHLEDPNQICIREEGKAPIYCLSPAQVRELKDHQANLITNINPELYREFDQAWQIEEIPIEHIDKINLDKGKELNLMSLNKMQVKALPLEKIQKFVAYESLPGPRCGWIKGDFLEAIPDKFLGYVIPEQIAEITNPELIKKLETIAAKNMSKGHPVPPGKWTSWIKADMVPSIDFDTQLKYLNRRDQISKVPDDLVKRLDPATQVPLIGPLQVKFLDGKEQIQACPLPLTSQLTKPQMPHISIAQVPYLKGIEQVQGLDKPEQIKALTPHTSIEKQTVNQMEWVSEKQLEHLEKEQVQGLSNPQLLLLRSKVTPQRWEELREGLKEEQVNTFKTKELIDLLSEQQITNWLVQDQLPFLTTEVQIQACPDKLLNLMAPPQIAHISKRQVPLLTFDNVKLVDKPRCEHLVETQMQWIAETQIGWLHTHHVKGLSSAQLIKLKALKDDEEWKKFQSEITSSQIALFDTQETIDLLNENQIHAHVSKNQVQYLTKPWQIQACPDGLVNTVDEMQFKHLLPEQMAFINTATQIQWVQPNQVRGLSVTQLLALKQGKNQDEWKPFQANITQDQANYFDRKELIDLLNEKQISDYLTQESQVPFLTEAWQIKACPNKFVKNLDPDTQVPQIAPAQVPHLEGQEQVEACPAKKKWVQNLEKEHFIYLTSEQTKRLSEDQIGKMDLLKEFKKLTPEQLAFVNPEKVTLFDDSLVKKIEQCEEAYPLAGRVKSGQLHLLTKKEVWKKHVTEGQINGINAAEMKGVSRGHPLWGRISPDTIHALDNKLIKKLPGKQLKHLDTKAQIRSIGFWKVKHLTRDQLKERSWGQFLVYTVGVTLLGVVSIIAAMIAYISTIPFLVLLANRKKGKYVIKQINTNPNRLYRFLKVYTTSPQKKKDTNTPK